MSQHTENIWLAPWERKEEVSVEQSCPRLGPASPKAKGVDNAAFLESFCSP